MSDNSKIEWTDATWNPVRGCTKISDGCKIAMPMPLLKDGEASKAIRLKRI